MELVGIENEAEFFPAGTLSDVLKDELREITSHWSHDDSTIDPVKRLSEISTTTLRSLASIRRASGKRRTDLVQEMRTFILSSLGYERRYQEVSSGMDENSIIPLAGAVSDTSGKNALWIIETPAVGPEDEASDPLDSNIERSQISTENTKEDTPKEMTIGELLGEGVFDLIDGPRYVLIMGQSQIVLVDKRKWPARSVLRFNLQEIFGRRDQQTLTVMACLLSREARVPEQGVSISDRLEEEAQRNANAVTTSLKRTVRDAIEILGQEVLDVSEGKYPSTFPDRSRKGVWIDGAHLSQECLKYMYRLLFLFYAEANPRLGLLDLKNPVYRRGYSLEGLREFECAPLRTIEDRENTFLWDSLQCTLRHIYDGIDCIDKNRNNGFFLPPVKVSLLDSKSTPLLSSLSLRNEAIQKVIRLLSLESTKKGTGRISYAKLGIGQLGAIYETLISFTGTVAKEDLIEVKSHKSSSKIDDSDDQNLNIDNRDSGNNATDGGKVFESRSDKYADHDKVDPLEPCWFAPHRRFDEFGPKRVVYKNGEALIRPKGSFIYRLSGRDREKSASYYTPEPLARTLVKYALMERCVDMAADDLLQLKILEPAMGSAAFLVEATNQIADLYLERKQKEVGELIPQEKVVAERQRVRAYITDRNCFGVDLNPIAAELASISLWLNSLHAGDFSPWNGNQLYVGNSLFGARRAYYSPTLLEQKKISNGWLNRRPTEIGWHREFENGNIWHWLLPAKGMANYEKEKGISPLFGEEQKTISAWKKGGFFSKFEAAEIELMRNLSKIANQLYEEVADHLKDIRKQTSDKITLWPNNEMSGNVNLKFYDKESLNEHFVGDKVIMDTLPFRRLKTAMDAWCALWVWPLEKADLLPSRKDFLHGMSLVLEGKISEKGDLEIPSFDHGYEAYRDFHNMMTQSDGGHGDEHGSYEKEEKTIMFEETNLETLISRSEWLKYSIEIASREKFIHFDLIFSDVMRDRGGFDLVVGNPPWAKPYWSEGNMLAEIDPLHVGLSASRARVVTNNLFKSAQESDGDRTLKSVLSHFASTFVSTKGGIEAMSSNVMNPFVGGGVTNLYHCFVDLSFRLVSKDGFAALIHQDGHLVSSKMREFRKNWYARISRHFKFRNEVKHKMFSEIGNRVRFSLNVYRGTPSGVKFDAFCDAFLVSQIEESYSHDGFGEVGGIKKGNGTWNTSGHKKRILRVDQDVLNIINLLSDSDGVPVDEARLILPYSVDTLDLFRQLSKTEKFAIVFSENHDIDLGVSKVITDSGIRICQISRHLSESDAQIDGTMIRNTGFRKTERMILQGPHLSLGNPIGQTPRRVCETHRAYDHVDLTLVPDDYVQRTNFVPDIDIQGFRSRLPRSSWSQERIHSDYYRVAAREMISRDSERSLIATLICPGVTHVSSVLSVAFDKDRDLISTLAQFVSLPLDYLVKVSGMEHLKIETLPWLEATDTACSRSLRLCCLTSAYTDIWNRCASEYKVMPWSSTDRRLELEGAVGGPALWQREAGLRTEFARRMALVEIDVIIAQDFGFTLDQLIEMYTTYFPVLMETERGTWYDQNGRIVWTCSKSLPGVGWLNENQKSPSKAEWTKILDNKPSELVCVAFDDTMPNGPREVERRFVGPFTLCDRIVDYRRAWAHFEKLKAQGGT